MKMALQWSNIDTSPCKRIFPNRDKICEIRKAIIRDDLWLLDTYFGSLQIDIGNRIDLEHAWADGFATKKAAMEFFDRKWKELGYETISEERAKRLILLI